MTFSGAQAAGRSKALQSNSTANFNANSAINVATAPNNNPGHKPACDRCKGQKLRCVWECGSDICRRCRRAQAVCQQPASRPFGRPGRSATHNTSFKCQDQPNLRVWLPGGTNNAPAEFQESNLTIQMPTADDEDRASSPPHAHAALNPPRYLGLAALSADPNVQLNNISSSHNRHEDTINW
ncbi:hypothetical protein N7478_011585 [Penicillium angulare]|uniref:uncharacterized protein n=1 Tax=Penicillium angulare TaxID=116970 RepID=UPI002540E9A7|nr:uncharacterized protein N7478_011585 [Penicillium angulare]KAJ5260990.1 hypothetical protein N7478_011585 [Penicillium angulare]